MFLKDTNKYREIQDPLTFKKLLKLRNLFIPFRNLLEYSFKEISVRSDLIELLLGLCILCNLFLTNNTFHESDFVFVVDFSQLQRIHFRLPMSIKLGFFAGGCTIIKTRKEMKNMNFLSHGNSISTYNLLLTYRYRSTRRTWSTPQSASLWSRSRSKTQFFTFSW